MSDRTMIAIGKTSVSVPRLAKRALQVMTATGLTALVALAIVAANNILLARGGPVQGFNVWYAFITRPDIIGTTLLTAVVTVAYLYASRGDAGRR